MPSQWSDLVLDDLRGETSECGMALAELAIRIRDLNALEANRAALAFERQAAFGGVVGAVFRSDRRVEHYEDATAEILVHECNDALRDADHGLRPCRRSHCDVRQACL